MPLDIANVPNPLFTYNQRSALEALRRMFLLRWSTGKYLTANAGNYGLSRPPLGFSDDDIFRACAQVIMAHHKNILDPIRLLCEIILGPAEDLWFQLAQNENAGRPFLHLKPYGHYFTYSNLVGGPPNPGERLSATHPKTGTVFDILAVHLDTARSRLWFNFIRSKPADQLLEPGLSFTGNQTGVSLKNASEVFQRDLDALPIYAMFTLYNPKPADPLDPSLDALREDGIFISPDATRGYARLSQPLTSAHAQDDLLYIKGGCWELYAPKARSFYIKVTCPELYPSQLPGNSYLHANPWIASETQRPLAPGDTNVYIQNLFTLNTDLLTFPRILFIDPDFEAKNTLSGSRFLTVTAFNPTSRVFTLSLPIPAGVHYPRGTKVKWLQHLTGQTSGVTSPGAQVIVARLNEPHPEGVWVVDPGGGSEEKVFVVGSSYQVRRLVAPLVSGSSVVVEVDRPFEDVDLSQTTHLEVLDTLGTGGLVQIQSISGRFITLTGVVGFSIDTTTVLASVGLVDSAGASLLTLDPATPVQGLHGGATALAYFLGLAGGLEPTWADHLPVAGYPPATPDGRHPGPYLFEPSRDAAYNEQGSGLVRAELDTTDLNDGRLYMARTQLAERLDPQTAPILFTVTVGGIKHEIRAIRVVDASLLPSQVIMNAWKVHPDNPDPGLPIRVVVAAEGQFGRTPVYYWGKGFSVSGTENLVYLSGVQRIHLAGTEVATYHTHLPIKAVSPASNPWGADPGFDTGEGQVLVDHGFSVEETVEYDKLNKVSNTQATLEFERGFVPQHGHDPFKVSNLEPLIALGVPIVRGDQQAIPRVDGFSFPFYLGGNAAYFRLRFVMDLVRAAGVEVTLLDDKDRVIPV